MDHYMLDHYSRFFSTYIYDSKISLEYDRRCDIMMYLFVTVLRLAWLVVGVLVGVVVGHGHLAELELWSTIYHLPK